MRPCNVVALLSGQSLAMTSTALTVSRRHAEYWGSTVTGRTQAYAQGDVLPRADNTRHVIDASSAAAASVTGNHLGIAYTTENIFSVKDYSAHEQKHYQPLRGISTYKVEPIQENIGPSASQMMESMRENLSLDLNEAWWAPLLKDFPSLRKPFTESLRTEFENFYIAALAIAHDDAAVAALSKSFVEKNLTQNYISFPMFWRVSEKLANAVEMAPTATRYSKLATRVAVERVTKLMLNTLAEQPWAHQDTTSPLFVDVSGFRPWHEAGMW